MDSFHSCWRKWGGNQSWQNHWQRLIIVCSGDFSRLFCLISFFSSLTFFSPVIITFSIYWFRFSACNIRRCTSSSTFSMLQHVFRLKCRSWAAFGNGTLVAPFRRHNVMRFDMRLKHFTILHRSFALVGWAIIRDHLGTCRPSTDRPTDRIWSISIMNAIVKIVVVVVHAMFICTFHSILLFHLHSITLAHYAKGNMLIS